MRSNIMLLVTMAWISSLSCNGNGKRLKSARPGATDAKREVAIWIEEDPRMPKDVVMRGCREWRSKNVECVEVATAETAKVRVYADDGTCVGPHPKTKKPLTALAWAFSGGKVTMMAKCLDMKDGRFEPHQLAAVTTHEVGHQLGIWEHVPHSCKGEKIATHKATGRKICGAAVMNPHYNPAVDVVTVIDALAFDERDASNSVLISDQPEIPICIYERRSGP